MMSLVGILAVVMAVVLVMAYRSQSNNLTPRLNRQERRELVSARNTLSYLRDMANEYKTIDNTDLPFKILDAVDAHKEQRAE